MSYGPFQLGELAEARSRRSRPGCCASSSARRSLLAVPTSRPMPGARAGRRRDAPRGKKPFKPAGKSDAVEDRKGRRVLVQRTGSDEARARNEDEARLWPAAPPEARLPWQARYQAAGRVMAMRVVGGRLRGRNIASPSSREIRPTQDRLRESVFNILIHAYDDPIEARGCSTCSPAPARSASRRCRAARSSRCSSTTAPKRARCCATMSRRSVSAASPSLSPRCHRSRPGASGRAVLAGVPRSALWQGACGESAGLVARWRLAGAGGAAGGGRGEGRRVHGARRF